MAKYQIRNTTTQGIIGGVVVVLLLLVGVLVFSSARTVQVGHVGVVTSFGKIINGTLDPGLHFVMPWHSVVPIDCRVKNTMEKTACYSKDLQQVEVDLSILTTLNKTNAVHVYETIGLQYLNQVKPRVFEILKQHVAKYEAEKLIESREKIRDEVLKTCRERLLEIVDVQDVVIANFDFSKEYEQAIERKQVALQDSLRAENELKKAKIEAEQAIETAKGEAEAITIRGEAIQSSPAVALLDAIKKWDGKLPQSVVFGGGDIPVVFPVK